MPTSNRARHPLHSFNHWLAACWLFCVSLGRRNNKTLGSGLQSSLVSQREASQDERAEKLFFERRKKRKNSHRCKAKCTQPRLCCTPSARHSCSESKRPLGVNCESRRLARAKEKIQKKMRQDAYEDAPCTHDVPWQSPGAK